MDPADAVFRFFRWNNSGYSINVQGIQEDFLLSFKLSGGNIVFGQLDESVVELFQVVGYFSGFDGKTKKVVFGFVDEVFFCVFLVSGG